MVGNRKKILIAASFVVLAAAGAIYTPIMLPPRDSTRALENSMVSVMKDCLGAEFRVVSAQLVGRERDPSGSWHLTVPRPERITEQLQKNGFAAAYDDDSRYLNQSVLDSGLMTKEAGHLTFFKAEIPLGKKSICTDTACNVSIGVGASGDIVVMIFRT